MSIPDNETTRDIGSSLARTAKCCNEYATPYFETAKTNLYRAFTDLPHTHRRTYCGHVTYHAWRSLRLTGAALADAVHALFPFWFPETSIDLVRDVREEYVEHIVSLQCVTCDTQCTACTEENRILRALFPPADTKKTQ